MLLYCNNKYYERGINISNLITNRTKRTNKLLFNYENPLNKSWINMIILAHYITHNFSVANTLLTFEINVTLFATEIVPSFFLFFRTEKKLAFRFYIIHKAAYRSAQT